MAAVGSVSQTLSGKVINARSPCLSPSASVLSALDVVQIGREGEDAVGDVGLSKGG